jgi:hypothetical protein
MTTTFSDEELERYFRMKQGAEDYLNDLIKYKRVLEMKKSEM